MSRNSSILEVVDMGLEIPVPNTVKFNTRTLRVPLYKEMSVATESGASNTTEDMWFQITKTRDGNYQLHDPTYIREALEYLYKAPEPKLIRDVKEALNVDISNAKFAQGDYGHCEGTLTLKIVLD